MSSILNLIKYMIILTLFICYQVQTSTINNDNNDMSDVDMGDTLYGLLPNQYDQYYRQQYRRASLRYHPHVLYKKASLKPIIGQGGKVAYTNRDLN